MLLFAFRVAIKKYLFLCSLKIQCSKIFEFFVPWKYNVQRTRISLFSGNAVFKEPGFLCSSEMRCSKSSDFFVPLESSVQKISVSLFPGIPGNKDYLR